MSSKDLRETDLQITSDAFEKLYCKHAITSNFYQQCLVEYSLGDWNYNMDFPPKIGQFTFANIKTPIEFQIIGTSTPLEFLHANFIHPSYRLGIFPQSRMEKTMKLQQLLKLIIEFREQQISLPPLPQFTVPILREMVERKEELPLNFIVRKLCAIVTELLGGVAYYRCPSNPGCALWIVLFPNPHFNREILLKEKTKSEILSRLNRSYNLTLLTYILINHRLCLKSALKIFKFNFQIEEKPNGKSVIKCDELNYHFTATFNKEFLLVSMEEQTNPLNNNINENENENNN